MSSMGGNLGLFGDLEQLNAGPVDALARNKSIAGVGIDPEGIDNNPAYYSFLLESAWRSERVNTTAWLQRWGTQRCGAESAAARAAWALLAATVYADSKVAISRRVIKCRAQSQRSCSKVHTNTSIAVFEHICIEIGT
jgi:alpha-N-acetylglucosaminidase